MDDHSQNKRMFWTSKAIEWLFAFIVTFIAAILGTIFGSEMRPLLVKFGLIEPSSQSEENTAPVQESSSPFGVCGPDEEE